MAEKKWKEKKSFLKLQHHVPTFNGHVMVYATTVTVYKFTKLLIMGVIIWHENSFDRQLGGMLQIGPHEACDLLYYLDKSMTFYNT